MHDVVTKSRDVTLLEVLDRVLDKGVVISGDMVISFASSDKMAQSSPVHYFNLFELLEAIPPT